MPTLASLERPVSSTTAQQLQMWRASILDGVLRGTLLFAFIALLGALNTAFHSYQQEKDLTPNALGLFAGVVSIYLAAFALIALATFSRKFPYRFRAGLLLGVYYVLAVLNLSLSALSGDGRVLLFAVVALTALLFDLRFSLGALAFSLLTLAAFGWLEVSGQIVISAERQLNATSAASWISGSVVFLVLCVAVLLSANYLLRMLARTLAEARTTLAREQRLRGALRTLSDINQLIVRERDLQHLLSEACHILVRGREYAFAWISLLNEDGVTARLAAASDPQLADPAAFIFRTNGSATGPLCAPAALRARSPIHIEPGAHDPCPSCPLLTHYPQRSAVALPLLSNDRAFGTLEVVHSASSGIFDDEETNLLQEMADNIAFALDSLSIEAERQTQTRFVAVLNDITRATLSAPDFNAMLQTLADQIGELFSADVCHITLWDEARGLALPGAAYGLMREAFTAVQGRPGKVTLTEAVLRAERVIVADDIAHSEFARIAQTAIQDLVNSVLQEMPASPAAQAALSEPSPLVSGMALPLIADGQKLGAVLIGYTQPHHFSPAEVARAEQAAAQVALAMAKARLFSETQTTAAELSRLYAAAQDLSASLETPKILNHLARHFVEALNGTSSYINGFSPDGQMLTVLAEYWSKAAVPTERKSDLGASMPRQDYPTVMQAVNKGEAVTLQTGMPGLSLVEQAQFVDYGIQSMLFVPVVVGGHVIGDAEIWESRRARVFTPAEIHLAQTLATHAASAIENARLFEMLEQRGAYFRALVENSAEGVAILDAQGNFRYVAPAEERLSGYAPETLLGQSAFRFIHPADLPRLQAAFEGGLQTPGATMTLEYRLQRRDGAWRHFEVTGQNLLHDQHMAGIVLNYRDITERKQAEQALQEKQALLLEAQHIAHIGNWWHDLVTGEIYWSDEFFRIIGREPQKPTIELGLAIMHPEDLPVLQKAMEESAAGKVNHEHEFRFIRPDGEIGWIHNRWIAIYDDAGREIKRVGTHQDITERKRAEAALRESEERYRIVSEMTSDYAVAERIEPDGRSVPEWITESFTRITGYSVEEAARPDFMRRLIHPDDWPIILQQSARFLAGQTANIEARILTKTGEMRWMHEVIHPIWDETQGRVVRIYGSARDITERKRAEVALYEREKHSQALLRLSQNLERSQTYAEALKAALEEIRHLIGYQTLWAYLFTEDKQQAKLILGSGGISETLFADEGVATLMIRGDQMLEEIVEATGIVVVEDARLDPRTDKAIVERLGNRTIVNIPVILFNKHLGAIGTGTFGDEGVHVPTPREQEFLAALASHMAVALDRIQLLAERVQTEAALRQRANELEALVSTSLALRNIDEVTPLISVVVRQALKVVNGDYGAVFLLEPETGDLVSAGWCEGDAPLLSAETALRHRPGEGITGHVARTGQIYITADVSRDPMAHILPEEADQLRETRSGISLPLRVQEAVIGVLHVWVRETGRVFSEADIRLLTAITEMASAAIHRAALYEQTERHAAELLAALAREQHLNEVARIISSTLDNETILHNVLRLAVELTVAEAGTIGLVMLDETPRLACRHYLFPAAPQVDEVAQGDGVGWRIIQTGRAERLADYSTDPQALPSLVAAGVRAFLGVPLSASQERLGVLGLFMFSTERQFTQRDQALAEAVGQEAGVALQNSRLYHDLQTRNADLERAVRRARVLAIEAAEANRLKSEFLANTSHELRTPVTAIIGSLDLVLNDVLDTPQEQQDFLQIAFRAAQGLREIVEQILDMMRLEAQKMDVRLQACDVTLLVEEVRWKAQPAVLTKGLTLNVQIPSHAPRLWADPEKVRQVLLILVENAIKFTECGSVTIRVDPPTIEHLSIVVSDTGLGIPPERQAKLFQPFVQADGSHTRTHGGLGLGLSISRRLAELMNGTLTLHSAGIGQGTTVTLTLPLAA